MTDSKQEENFPAMGMASFDRFQNELNRLVSTFERGFKDFTAPEYSEARVREDFLNPLFRALGWDVENQRGLVQSQREVEIESRTDVAGRAKRADYLFRVDGRERFVCEAKKPRETLGDGYSDLSEAVAGTEGTNSASFFDFADKHWSSTQQGFVLKWYGSSHRTYQPQWSTNLPAGVWSNCTGLVDTQGRALQSVSGTNGWETAIDTNNDSLAFRYYRIKVAKSP